MHCVESAEDVTVTCGEMIDARARALPCVIANAMATVSLCAAEIGYDALAIDMSRCHLKMFGGEGAESTSYNSVVTIGSEGSGGESTQEESATGKRSPPGRSAALLAMWITRGRAWAGLGRWPPMGGWCWRVVVSNVLSSLELHSVSYWHIITYQTLALCSDPMSRM